jgi:hypothetical protein
MLRRYWQIIVGATMGLVVGLVGEHSSLLDTRTQRSESPDKPDIDVDEILERLSRVERGAQSNISSITVPLVRSAANVQNDDDHNEEVILSPEEVVEVRRQQWAARLAAHEHEPIDPGWQGAASESVEEDLFLAGNEGEKFDVLSVTCRTQTCLAVMQWPDRQTALPFLPELISHRYPFNCQRTMYMPQGEERPYLATLLLDCPPETREWDVGAGTPEEKETASE